MQTTGINVNARSNKTTGRISRRLGVFGAAVVAVLSTLAMTGAVSSQTHGSAKPTSGYTQIDTSDHPTNPVRCTSRFGC